MERTKQPVGRAQKIVAYLLLALCCALFAYCLGVMIYRLCTAESAKRLSAVTRFLAEAGVIAFLSLPAFDLRFHLFSWRNKAAKVAGFALRVVIVLVCAFVVALGVTIVVTGAIRRDGSVDTVCVLGLAVDGEELPKDLVLRLDRAAAYHADHPDAVFVLTGGNSDDPFQTEAAYMQRYLASHGFEGASDKLIVEPQAKTTVENFVYTAQLVDKTSPPWGDHQRLPPVQSEQDRQKARVYPNPHTSCAVLSRILSRKRLVGDRLHRLYRLAGKLSLLISKLRPPLGGRFLRTDFT